MSHRPGIVSDYDLVAVAWQSLDLQVRGSYCGSSPSTSLSNVAVGFGLALVFVGFFVGRIRPALK